MFAKMRIFYVFIFSIIFFQASSQVLSIRDSLLGIVGGEDITIDYETGFAYISSQDRRSFFGEKKPKQGNLFLYDFNTPGAVPVSLTLNLMFEFHPHGIYLLKKENKKYLFVINHYSKSKSRIERFQIDGKRLLWEKSFEDKLIYSPNDLVAIDKDKFFVTNDQKKRRFFWKTLEGFFRFRSGNIVFYDGNSVRKAYKKRIGFANGIQYLPDSSFLFVGSSLEKRLYLFYVNEDFSLTLLRKKKMKTALDNLEWDTEGNLWITGHSNLIKFISHSMNEKKKSPWDILKLTPEHFQDFSKKNVPCWHFPKNFQNTENCKYSGASVFVMYKNKGLVGSVFEPYILLINIR